MVIRESDRAMRGYTSSHSVDIVNSDSPEIQFNETKQPITQFLKTKAREFRGIKYNIVMKVRFTKADITQSAYFSSPPITTISENINLGTSSILNKIDTWISNGSGWTVDKVEGHFINVVVYRPLRGSSYEELPKELKNSKMGLLNIQNKDDKCFMWCHLAYLYPAEKNGCRVTNYRPHIDKVDYSGIKFPVTINQIPKIENQNGNLGFNVFGYEDKQVFPLYITKKKDVCNILLYNNHYILIKDFNRLMFNQTKYEGKKHFCFHCLQCFSSEAVLQKHKPDCMAFNGMQAIKMPKEKVLKFTNFHKQLKAPFAIYADFEAINEKVCGPEPSDKESFTHKYQKHTDCSYGYKLVCIDPQFSKPVKLYRGPNAVYNFIEAVLEEVKYCKSIKKEHFNKPLVMSEEDEALFQSQDSCHICGQKYENSLIVRDHCHITGKFRGSAHEKCNINFRLTDKIPVFFHNLRGYDSHFIMQQIGNFGLPINVIPNNMEKYMAFMVGKHLVFLDSFQYMASSLDALASNLSSYPFVSQEFNPDMSTSNELMVKLVTQKGVYPYDYMDSFSRFDETQLPAIEDFYSTVYETGITQEQYKHAASVWKAFGCKNLGDYHDLYLKTDVLLLTDVFENFRETCLKYYKLDPCHYFTSPGLSWDACLKMTGVNLQLLSDVNMYQFIEKGLRGGVSYIAHRYAKANNKYLPDYDKEVETSYITYLDANNLYGWAMSQCLPTGQFKWLDEKEMDKLNLGKFTDKSAYGLILEVDLEYPEDLHDLHNDYPLAPEQIMVEETDLSPYCKKLRDQFHCSVGTVKKLVPNLRRKEKYVVHYRNLQLYLDLGLKVTKVHRVLKFRQSPWLKEYIDFNTGKRKEAKNAFEKDFFKLMNNSVFGKTMENLRKRIDVKLITNQDALVKWAARPSYITSKIFSENLVAIHRKKPSLELNRPTYVGMCILDLSKHLMYDFHYNFIKKKYGSQARLLFTDTDSLTYHIKTDEVYEDFWAHKELFDNSDYKPDSPFFDDNNKKVIGKFKDEAAGVPIVEFVGLKSKMYSYVTAAGKNGKTAKGVKKQVIKNTIKHEDYKKVLFTKTQTRHTMKGIRSDLHQLGTYKINKTSLSCFDDKRYILDDGVSTLAYS